MSAGIIVGIVVAVIVIGAVVLGVMAALRRRRLKQRLATEYDRLAGERDSRRKAEAELTERERRVDDLDIQPLTDLAQASYAASGRASRSSSSTRRRTLSPERNSSWPP